MPQGLSAGPQRPTRPGPAGGRSAARPGRARRRTSRPACWRARPLRAAPHTARGDGGRFPGWFHGWFGCRRCTPWPRRLHRVGALVAPRSRLGVHLLHPDGAVIHSFADGGSGTGARFSAQEFASTLTRSRSSAVLPRSGPPGLLSHSPPSGTVHQCSLGSCLCSSRTVADAGEHGPTLLESVLGATLQEFESPILRHL